MKYQFIEEHRDEYPITLMCRSLAVARTGYYRWRKQPLRARKVADLVLLMHIRDVFEQSRETYGSHRIHAELADQGVRCGRKRVARLMYSIKIMAPNVTATALNLCIELPNWPTSFNSTSSWLIIRLITANIIPLNGSGGFWKTIGTALYLIRWKRSSGLPKI